MNKHPNPNTPAADTLSMLPLADKLNQAKETEMSPESPTMPPQEPLSREDYLGLAKVCRNIDNRDIDMHPGKDNRENYPESPENWANEIEMTPEEENKLIEIYRWRIDNDLLSWDPVKASQVRIREKQEAESKATPRTPTESPDLPPNPSL